MRSIRVLTAVAAVALAAAACGGSSGGGSTGGNPTSSGKAAPAVCPSGPGSGSVTVGAFNFSESKILANAYADALDACGYQASVRTVGNREVTEPALEQGQLDVVPEYAATLTEFLNKKVNGPDAPAKATGQIDKTMQALKPLAQKQGLVVLEPSQATDKNAFAVSSQFAKKNNLSTLSDLAKLSQQHPLVLGGPPECAQRPFCEPGLKKVYGMKFKNFVALDSGGPLTKKAIQSGKVDVGLVFTSDGSLDQLGLTILDDNKNLQASDNVVPAVNAKSDAKPLDEALDKVSAALTTDKLRKLNAEVDLQRKDPDKVAKQFLQQAGVLPSS